MRDLHKLTCQDCDQCGKTCSGGRIWAWDCDGFIDKKAMPRGAWFWAILIWMMVIWALIAMLSFKEGI